MTCLVKWCSQDLTPIHYIGASLAAQMVKHLPTMRETQVRSVGQEDPVEKEMATHSSTHAWKIPWTEEPVRLQSMGLQRVRHDWAISLQFTSHYTELGLSGKESTSNAGDTVDTGLISESGRSPGGGHGNPLLCSCLETCMDRGAWWATAHGAEKRQTGLKWLSTHYTVLIGVFFFRPQFRCHHLREASILY